MKVISEYYEEMNPPESFKSVGAFKVHYDMDGLLHLDTELYLASKGQQQQIDELNILDLGANGWFFSEKAAMAAYEEVKTLVSLGYNAMFGDHHAFLKEKLGI